MSDDLKSAMQNVDLVELTADLVAKYVSNNHMPAHEVTPFFRAVYQKLAGAEQSGEARGEPAAPAQANVPTAQSVHDDYLICLEDGQKLTMLKRYLRTQFDMSPEEYRKKWNLPPDYPMVAPSQSLKRSRNAKKLGLGLTVRRSKQA